MSAYFHYTGKMPKKTLARSVEIIGGQSSSPAMDKYVSELNQALGNRIVVVGDEFSSSTADAYLRKLFSTPKPRRKKIAHGAHDDSHHASLSIADDVELKSDVDNIGPQLSIADDIERADDMQPQLSIADDFEY